MLNNKGQSLVMFVLIIPIFLLIFILIVDGGEMLVLKKKLDNINNIAINYGIDNVNEIGIEEKLKELVMLNSATIDVVNVSVNDNKVYITIKEYLEGHFLGLVDLELITVTSSYVGYLSGDEKIIERN